MKNQTEKGQAIVLLVLLIVGLLAIAGLAVDGGRVYAERRSVQNAADNAALSAARALCLDLNVQAAALSSALQNGFDNDGTANSVIVNNPPAQGPNAGDGEYVEVTVTSNIVAGFAQLFFSDSLQTSARAVGHCVPESSALYDGAGIIALDPDDDCSFGMNGNNAVINVTGGGIQVNSNDEDALCVGNATIASDDDISVVGNYDIGPNGSVSPTPTTSAPPVPDPLAGLEPPDLPPGACLNYSLGGNNSDTIDPGLYCGINVSSQSVLTMNPGIYYIQGGDFSFSGQGDLYATGVMIYMDEGNFDLTGGGTVVMSAPTSGPWAGMMLFMDQESDGTLEISGHGGLTLSGTIYASGADITLTGSGAGNTIYAQVIGNTFSIGGNGQMDIIYNEDGVFNPGPDSALIELAE